MINRIFGKPKLPILLSDSILIVNEKKVIPLNHTYLFISKNIFKISKVGDDWITDIKVDRVRTVGYFTSVHSDIFIAEVGVFNEKNNQLKIVGNVIRNGKTFQHQIFGVSLNKTNSHFDEKSHFEAKFSATQVDIIVF